MSIFKRKEKRDTEGFRPDDPAATLAKAFGLPVTPMTFEMAMQLPPISASVDFISSICARVPIKLYRETLAEDGSHTEEITDDRRVRLLNDCTGDSLNAFQMKKAWVTDYFGYGQGYIYIHKGGNKCRSLHYVEQRSVAINTNPDPIFKTAQIFVADRQYFYWNFLRLCRNTKDGFKGKSIIDTNGELIALMYNTMRFEQMLMDTGGNKKGFLKSTKKLSREALEEIRATWRDLYSRNSNNMMILNSDLDYKETSATSTELQLNENKMTNNDALTLIFLLSARALQGASDDDIVSAVKTAVIPIIEQMEQAFNEGLLLESEKDTMYWACDTSALERGDILKRFQAYKLAIEGNFMQADEIRYKEDMPALGLNWIRLGLQDVLYDPKTKQIYTPNTNSLVKMGEAVTQINDELRYNPDQPRGDDGRWVTSGGGGSGGGKSSAESVDNSEKSGIIGLEEVSGVTISSIENPIEQKHTGKGNPNAIVTFGVSLNERQKALLEKLPEYDSRIIVSKKSVNMADLSALTAETGDEFAMFTKKNNRLIIRGNSSKVNIDVVAAQQLAKDGYKWSGHTHPGLDYNCLNASPGDKAILRCFTQDNSVIYNSKGQFLTFEKEG